MCLNFYSGWLVPFDMRQPGWLPQRCQILQQISPVLLDRAERIPHRRLSATPGSGLNAASSFRSPPASSPILRIAKPVLN